MRDMRLRVAKLILRGVASSTIAQAEGYPSYKARALSSYFSYLVYPLVVNLNLNYYYYYFYFMYCTQFVQVQVVVVAPPPVERRHTLLSPVYCA